MPAKGFSPTTLVIDIAPGSVKGAVVGMSHGSSPQILFEKEHRFQFNERMINAFKQLLRDVLNASPGISHKFSPQPEHILMCFSKPWAKDDKALVSKLEDEIIRAISFRKGVAFDEWTNVFLSGVCSLYDIKDATLARMNRESTECFYIKDGKKEKEFVIDFGIKDIEQRFSQALKQPEELTSSYVSLAEQDLWDDDMRRLMEKTLDDVESAWMKKSVEMRSFPGNILIVATHPYEKLFSVLFKDTIPGAKVSIQDPITILAAYSRNLL